MTSRSIALALSVSVAASACAVEAQEIVVLGVDALLAEGSEHAALLEGKRVGLITNPSGVDGWLAPTADRLARDQRWQLVQLYGPEHGIRGDAAAGDRVGDEVDALTGVRVESLYGERRAPSAETLAGVDVVVFDIQDIGSRTYTYVSTLGEAMKACAAARKPLVVLDRPNPIGGTRFEGAVIEEQWKSFIGWAPIPVTHGMTVGEIARYYDEQLELGCDLIVVPMRGWKREMVWEDTRLEWTTTSPHIPHALQAHLYVATGMVAASTKNVSDAVGSPMPFEAIGGEFIDGAALAGALAALDLPGVRFQATAYKPFYGKFKDKPLRGARLVLDNPRSFRPLHTALSILVTLRQMYPEQLELGDQAAIGKHWGTARVLEQLRAGASVADVERSWSSDLSKFEKARARVLIY